MSLAFMMKAYSSQDCRGIGILSISHVKLQMNAEISRQKLRRNSSPMILQLGGVYMRKLAPARVSYRHDFLISYRVYMMTGLFHI